MQCVQIRQLLNEADLRPGTPPHFTVEALNHIATCPACGQEYQSFSQARQLFAALQPVEPVPSFGPAWRARLHEVRLQEEEAAMVYAKNSMGLDRKTSLLLPQERHPKRLHWSEFPLFNNWKIATALGTTVIVVCLIAGFTNSWWQLPNSNPILVRHTIPNPTVRQSVRQVALAGDHYKLQIRKVGPQGKQVQRIIRDFHRLTEGGASYAYRDPEVELASFHGLTLQQARNLKEELEKAGAVVKYFKEK